jgi:hypothetical protein
MKAMKEKDPKRVLVAAEAWRPWRSYAVMHLWASLGSAPLTERTKVVATVVGLPFRERSRSNRKKMEEK